MRRYLLDSALVAAFLHGRKAAVNLVTPWIINQEAATSILAYAEVVEYLKGLPDFEFDLTLVTVDSDFERVPDLKVMRVVLTSK